MQRHAHLFEFIFIILEHKQKDILKDDYKEMKLFGTKCILKCMKIILLTIHARACILCCRRPRLGALQRGWG
jgi:hypothetical protein